MCKRGICNFILQGILSFEKRSRFHQSAGLQPSIVIMPISRLQCTMFSISLSIIIIYYSICVIFIHCYFILSCIYYQVYLSFVYTKKYIIIVITSSVRYVFVEIYAISTPYVISLTTFFLFSYSVPFSLFMITMITNFNLL